MFLTSFNLCFTKINRNNMFVYKVIEVKEMFLLWEKSIILLLAILIFISVPVNAVIGQGTTTHFIDVKKTDWFYKDVMELTRRGLISGYPDNTFKPKRPK